jgi:hypothetical protein
MPDRTQLDAMAARLISAMRDPMRAMTARPAPGAKATGRQLTHAVA